MKNRLMMRLAAMVFVAHALINPAWGQNAEKGPGEKEKPPERLIYLPFKNLKAVFEKPDGSVLVPYADYIKRCGKKRSAMACENPTSLPSAA